MKKKIEIDIIDIEKLVDTYNIYQLNKELLNYIIRKALSVEDKEEIDILTDTEKFKYYNEYGGFSGDGKEYLIPAIPLVVDEVDIDSGRVTITPLKGIFEDED